MPATFGVAEDNGTDDLTGQTDALMEILQVLKANNIGMDGMVDLIILKAKDPADGLRAFDKGDKPILMKLATDKVGEIFAALFGKQLVEDDDEKFEARVGNSKKTAGE